MHYFVFLTNQSHMFSDTDWLHQRNMSIYIYNLYIVMCVDDFQFRHHSARREKLCRRFVFKSNDGGERVFLVNISQFQRYNELRLCQILMHLNKKGLNVKDYSFFMPQLGITIEAGEKCRVPFDVMTPKEILFEMRPIENDQMVDGYDNLYFVPLAPPQPFDFEEVSSACCFDCSKSDASACNLVSTVSEKSSTEVSQVLSAASEEFKSEKPEQQFTNRSYNIRISVTGSGAESRKHKEQEKTIDEALMKTKTWRLLHENCNYSLTNSAIMVELSKKTLDDYFLVLRVGEYHGYNFKANLHKKIGHLRAFIRSQPVKITGRLPKQVRSFDLVPDPDLSPFMCITNWSKISEIQELNEESPDKSVENSMGSD